MRCFATSLVTVLALFTVPTSGVAAPTGTTWYLDTITQAPRSFVDPSLAYDSLSRPSIAYFDDTGDYLLVAVKKSGAWHVDTVVNAVTRELSHVLDSNGVIHLVFHRLSTGLQYAQNAGMGWDMEPIASTDVGDRLSLAMGPGNVPKVAYRDETNNKIFLAARGPTNWVSEEVDASAGGYRDLSLAIDSNGNPHIAYVQRSPFRLLYATKSGGVWTYETIDSTGTPVVRARSLAIDASDVPHIAYREGGTGDLAYGHRTGGVWSTEIAELGVGGLNVGLYPTLVLSSDGTPHIGHQDDGSDDARYTTHTGVMWTSVPVAQDGDVGRFAEIAMAPDGNLGMVWYDVTNAAIGYGVSASTLDATLRLPPTMTLHVRPNPAFSGEARLTFTLSSTSHLRLAIYDAQGRIVRVLANGSLPPGPREYRWDGTGERGVAVEPGLYFVRLDLDGVTRGRGRIAILR